ncbi:MAG TPA: hypothetical protein VK543_16310, partial [Puia sp.]|nr:hypothetical protein [Puia sp.]
VDAFVKENADLAEELNILQQSKMQPDRAIIFENKKSLLKHPAGNSLINEFNYEEFFVLYVDGELSESQKNDVQEYVLLHPRLKQELDLLQQTCLVPDQQIVFERKEVLYRQEEEEKVIRLRFPWIRMAAAAIILLLAGFLVFRYAGSRAKQTNIPANRSVAAAENDNLKKNDVAHVTPATNDSLYHAKQVERAVTMQVPDKKVKGDPVPKKYPRSVDAESDESMTKLSPPVHSKTNERAPVLETGKTEIPAPATLIAATDHQAQNKAPEAETETKQSSKGIAYNDMTADTENGISILTSSSAGKNKMRGFFRKVSRVFEKRTGIDDESNKRAVLVGNFQIALK